MKNTRYYFIKLQLLLRLLTDRTRSNQLFFIYYNNANSDFLIDVKLAYPRLNIARNKKKDTIDLFIINSLIYQTYYSSLLLIIFFLFNNLHKYILINALTIIFCLNLIHINKLLNNLHSAGFMSHLFIKNES